MHTYDNWKDSWQTLLPDDVQRISRQLTTQPLSLTMGGVIKRFEKTFAKFAGTEYAVATNNGTSAIYSALWAVGVGAGDEVLVCDYGFVAMAGAIATLKATMVPVDIDEDTLTISPADIKEKITSKTKALLVHNPWGVPAMLDKIRDVTNLPIILDASHAHGATYQDKPIASWADITCFSLGMGKLITGGELGCAVTDSAVYRDKMIVLGHTNRTPFDLQTDIWNRNNIGLKFRPHVVALEIALCQMKRFEEKKTSLITTCERIERIFSEFGFKPQSIPEGGQRVYWRIVFQVDSSYWYNLPAATINTILKEVGMPVEDNPYWPLLQHQSPFLWEEGHSFIRHTACPKSIEVSAKLVTLPAPVAFEDQEQFNNIKNSLLKARELASVQGVV